MMDWLISGNRPGRRAQHRSGPPIPSGVPQVSRVMSRWTAQPLQPAVILIHIIIDLNPCPCKFLDISVYNRENTHALPSCVIPQPQNLMKSGSNATEGFVLLGQVFSGNVIERDAVLGL